MERIWGEGREAVTDYYPPFEGEPEPLGEEFQKALDQFAASRRFIWLKQITRELSAPWKGN